MSTRSCNERSAEIARAMAADAEVLNVEAHRLENGATWIDAGIRVEGSLEAGRLYALACLGGLGTLGFWTVDLDGARWPALSVTVPRPVRACMGCQYAGWAIKVERESGSYRAMGSGPARMLGSSEPLLDRLGARERAETAVLALETRKVPDEGVAAWVAERCGVAPEGVILMTAPTASLAGSVQIAARMVETGIHKMVELGLPVEAILSASGTCPIPPVAGDDRTAMGRTNDAVLYGGTAWYALRGEDDRIAELSERLASSCSPDYGRPFLEIFERYDRDFYRMDPLLFSPAEVFVNNLNSGRTFHAGRFRGDILRAAWLP